MAEVGFLVQVGVGSFMVKGLAGSPASPVHHLVPAFCLLAHWCTSKLFYCTFGQLSAFCVFRVLCNITLESNLELAPVLLTRWLQQQLIIKPRPFHPQRIVTLKPLLTETANLSLWRLFWGGGVILSSTAENECSFLVFTQAALQPGLLSITETC